MGTENPSHEVTRKAFLTGAVATSATGVSACALFSTEPAGSGDADGGGDARESAALADRVARDDLPPLARRLPDDPLVVEPVDEPGRHGGTWRTLMVGGADRPWMERTIGYEGLLRYSVDWQDILPNVAASWEVSDDARRYVFHLRPGMKWSDGHPFGVDDVMFWFDAVFMNDQLTPVKESMLLGGTEPVVVEPAGDHAVSFRFSTPNALLPELLASGNGNAMASVMMPRHYLGQFHPDHNPDTLDQLVEESGLDDWMALFQTRADWAINPALPVLHAWSVTSSYDGSSTQVVAERNPYYWKVDPEGRQLPYFDSVVYNRVEDNEVALLKVLGGEVDIHSRHINSLQNKPVLAQARDSGGFHFFELLPDPMNSAMLTLNLTHPDPVKRRVFDDRAFRAALSHAINRRDIIDVVYRGQGEPWQGSPRRETPFYNEQLAHQFVDYDVEEANRLLDASGYDRRDSEGFRLGPDGARITIQVDVTVEEGPEWVDLVEFVVDDWRAVGVDARTNTVGRSLVETRRDSNRQDIAVTLAFGGVNVIMDPREYFPHSGNEKGTWVDWYTSNGREGDEPPADVRRQMRLYRQLKETPAEAERIALMRQIVQIAADRFPAIGINLPANGYGIVRDAVRNVPRQMYSSQGWTYPEPAPANPCQFYFAES